MSLNRIVGAKSEPNGIEISQKATVVVYCYSVNQRM